MEQIIHPISGEKGYFISDDEKEFFKALVSIVTPSDARGVGL